MVAQLVAFLRMAYQVKERFCAVRDVTPNQSNVASHIYLHIDAKHVLCGVLLLITIQGYVDCVVAQM